MNIELEKQKVIEKPQIVIAELKKENGCEYGKFVWEPLERGYGITLGNSLRRVIMSSLPGVAVTRLKIDGVLHEFSTIKGVREDVTEIILNIKELRLKMYDNNSKTLRIQAKGEGVVLAKDIITSSDIEVLNPDLHIATLESDAVLNIEMLAECGCGYVSADKNKQADQPIGSIPIDAIFSPIRKVNYTVSDTRVGNVTNYDKLVIEVWTDCSMKPEEAMSVSAGILIEKLQMVQDLSSANPLFKSINDEEEEEDLSVDDIETTVTNVMTIEDLDLSVRAFNCLKRAGFATVDAICKLSNNDLKQIRNLGSKSIEEIKHKLQSHGLSLVKDTEEL